MATGTDVLVRDCVESDMASITEIYAHYVLETTCNLEYDAPDEAAMRARRDAVVATGLPYLVAVLENRLVGWAYATQFRPRKGLVAIDWMRDRGGGGYLPVLVS